MLILSDCGVDWDWRIVGFGITGAPIGFRREVDVPFDDIVN